MSRAYVRYLHVAGRTPPTRVRYQSYLVAYAFALPATGRGIALIDGGDNGGMGLGEGWPSAGSVFGDDPPLDDESSWTLMRLN